MAVRARQSGIRDPESALRLFRKLLGDGQVHADSATLDLYAADETPRRCVPRGVLFPHDHDQVRDIVAIARATRTSLVPRGAGSGNVGGATPVPNSYVVSFECMNQIRDLDPADRVVVAQPGVVTADLDAAARAYGLFYPPNPGSAAFCRIGGNIATNAAGPRSLKYGVTRDYVLSLKAVDGRGRSLTTGSRATKSVVGYDLTRLLVGSEGTLALVTEAAIRLLPAPAETAVLQASYSSAEDACAAVGRVMRAQTVPCALEFLDERATALVREAGVNLPAAAQATLIVEADGSAEDIAVQLPLYQRALQGHGMLELAQARTPAAVATLWATRSALSGAVKRRAPLKINEDVAVPVSQLGALVSQIEKLAVTHQLEVVSFGHAGNGNLHVNVLIDPAEPGQKKRAALYLRDLFQAVLSLGGTLSGEHGIGLAKRRFVPLEVGEDTLALMWAIKQQLDPMRLLNPGKALPAVVRRRPRITLQ